VLGEMSILYKDCSVDELTDPSTWLAICPFLTCSVTRSELDDGSSINGQLIASAGRQMKSRGYFSVPPEQFDLKRTNLVELLARGVLELMKHGFPPLFILMYDESWLMTRIIQQFVPAACGEGGQPRPRHVGDFYVFAVLNAREQASLGPESFKQRYRPSGPHRDRPTAGPSTFSPLLMPQYCSIWLALSDATTSNSCLYVVPLASDKGYYLSGDAHGSEGGVDEPVRIESCIAQPLKAGGLLCFSHRLLHWGSALEQWALEEDGLRSSEEDGEDEPAEAEALPRIAFTTAFAQDSFEQSYFSEERFPMDGSTPLSLRLGLVAGQSIQYEHLAPLAKHELALTRRIFHAQKDVLSSTYFEKISSACQWLTFLQRTKTRQA